MKILTGSNIRKADLYTIQNEPISSLDLMERASEKIASMIIGSFGKSHPYAVFAGKGNNGGDGLAVARLLSASGCRCSVVLVGSPEEMTEETRTNYERLPESVVKYVFNMSFSCFPDTVIVDAVLGSGLNGSARGAALDAIRKINSMGNKVVSVDVPSGMPSDLVPVMPSADEIVHADMTVSVAFPKLPMLFPGTGDCTGEIRVVDIGLSGEFVSSCNEACEYVDEECIRSLEKLPSRNGLKPGSPFEISRFDHKGKNGHLLMVCGSVGMMGAAVLAVGGALRSGCGIVTAHIPFSERFIMQVAHPSAIVSCDSSHCFSELREDMTAYSAVGVGCGLGKDMLSVAVLEKLLKCGKSMLLDADALNIVSAERRLVELIPEGSVLTPHLGELRRLCGDWESWPELIAKARDLAERTSSVVVVKGANTMTVSPDGRLFFNSTGTPGMAKGGSGDVLAGYIAGLLARGCDPLAAAVCGVYRHGLAGMEAARRFGTEGMNSKDLTDFLR